MGILRNRVVPLGRTFRDGCPAGQPGNLPVPASGRERGSYQADSPTFGRAAATEAGFAVRVYIHPLVKVIIFPTSFSVLPWHRLTGRATRAVTPAGRSGVRNKNTP